MVNKKGLSKKGIFFTMISIMIGTLMIISFIIYNEYTLTNKAMTIETRVDTMNRFIKDLDDDIQRGVFTSGFRSLFSLTGWSCANATYIYDLDAAFNEAFLNGTYNDSDLELMEDSEFTFWIQRIQNIANDLSIDVNITVNDISIIHSSPWHVRVILNASFNVKDLQNTAEWKYNRIVQSNLPIQGFQDPIYIIEPGKGGVVNTIEINNFTVFVGPDNNTYNLSYLANSSQYTAWSQGPSFLMRLIGNLSASPDGFGIESLVNLLQLSNHDIDTENKTVVDYIYFSNDDPVKFKVKNMPNWFYLDNLNNGTTTHLEKYQVEDLVS